MTRRKKTGLVLGSGSSRGWAHIGAIEALEEAGIPIDMVAGCSVGAYVGALYACGSLGRLKEFVLRMDGRKVFSYFDVVLPRTGLLDGSRKLKELFSMHTAVREFAELDIPVMMVATDLHSGDKVVLKSGDLLPALRATMSYPGLFEPARVKGRWLVDGGLVDPVPVGVARAAEADVVIAVDLNSGILSRRRSRRDGQAGGEAGGERGRQRSEWLQKVAGFYESAESIVREKFGERLNRDAAAPDIVETVMTSVGIMQERITRINLAVDPADVLIQPRLGSLKMMDFDQVEHAIEEGYISMKEKVEDIRNLVGAADR